MDKHTDEELRKLCEKVLALDRFSVAAPWQRVAWSGADIHIDGDGDTIVRAANRNNIAALIVAYRSAAPILARALTAAPVEGEHR